MPRYLPLMILLLASCQPQTVGFRLPKDEGTAEEKQKIKDVVASIEADLLELGIPQKLSALPIVVTKLEDRVAARCYKDDRDRALGIAVTAATLADVGADPRYLPLSYKAILHEIGHCYFDRDHEEVAFVVPNQNLRLVMQREEAESNHLLAMLSPTIMEPVDLFAIPVELRSYYVGEVAGLERMVSWEDLARFGEVELVPAQTFTWGQPTQIGH